MNLAIGNAASPRDIEQARALFLEYAAWLNVDLCFQGFDQELATLPGAYAPPRGRLLLARAEGEVFGCSALRPLEPGVGEVKRLYVRPAFRGRGIAKRLAAEIIDAARMIGYARLRLDTLAFMHEAAVLYRGLGFVATALYNDNLPPGVVYLQLEL